MNRFQQKQRNKIKEHFKEHPYYRLCQSVFDVFQEQCPTMVMTPEQMFADAADILDSIKANKDASTEYCKGLWTNTYNLYREQVGTAIDKEDTKTEVAMLFYMVMYGVTTINHSHYRGTLQKILHAAICKFYGRKNCLDIETKLREPVNQHTVSMLTWMEEYFVSSECLTKEIDNLLRPSKPKKTEQGKKDRESKLFTIPYVCNDENLRTNRITFVRRKWEEWGWIEANTDVHDFEYFFDGKSRDCQLKWKCSNTTVLYVLLDEILKQKYVGKVKGCSAHSIILNQFHTSYDTHRNRVDALNLQRIELTIKLLNPKPIEFRQLPYNYGDDISDAALQEVFANNMHITKDLNKFKD